MIHNIPQAKAKKQLVLYTNLRLRDGWVGGDWCKSNKARPNKEENRGKLRNITNITINKTKIRQLETNENNRINMNQYESMINRKSLTSVSSGRLFTPGSVTRALGSPLFPYSLSGLPSEKQELRNWELGIIGIISNSLGIGCNYKLLGDTAQQEWCVCNRLDWFQEIPSLEAQSFRKKGKDCNEMESGRNAQYKSEDLLGKQYENMNPIQARAKKMPMQTCISQNNARLWMKNVHGHWVCWPRLVLSIETQQRCRPTMPQPLLCLSWHQLVACKWTQFDMIWLCWQLHPL